MESEESTGPFGGGKKSGFQQSRPGGAPEATLSGRLLATQRPQPGCELGLRRTLLADPGSYSLCLSRRSGPAVDQRAFGFPSAQIPPLRFPAVAGKGFISPFVGYLGVVKQEEEREGRKRKEEGI